MDIEKLKKPSKAPALLSKALASVLNQLMTVSEVRAARIGSDTAHLKPGSSPPSGNPRDVVDWLRVRWRKATCNWERLLIIKEAQQLLAESRFPPDRAYQRGTREWKLAIARDERISVEVACTYGISSSYVRQLRAQFREGKFGPTGSRQAA